MKIPILLAIFLLLWFIALQYYNERNKPKKIMQDSTIVFRNNTIIVDSNYIEQDSLTKEFIKVTDSFIVVTEKGLVLAKQNRENGYLCKRVQEMRKLNNKQWQLIEREKQINRQIDSVTNKH